MSNVPPGNGLWTARTSPVQIQVVSPLSSSSRPIVTITTRICEPRSTGRITAWWIPNPPTNDTSRVIDERRPVADAVVRRQRPGDVGREHRHLALGEVDHAGGAVDEHERQRERAVDAAGGETRDDLLEELRHQ